MEKIKKILLLAYLLLFPFGVLAKLPIRIKNFPEVNFYLADIVVGFLGVIGLVGLLGKIKKRAGPLPKLTEPILFFLGITAFSLLVNIPNFSGREIFVGFLYWLRLAAYFMVYFVAKEIDWEKGRELLEKAGLMVVLLGLGQYFFFPNLDPLKKFGWDPHFGRLAGTFLDPNYSGIILVLILIFLGANFKPKTSWWLAVGGCWLALALTYSRSSYLAFLAGMGVLLILKKKIKLIPLIIFIIFITVINLPRNLPSEGVKLERTASVGARLRNWRETLVIAKDHFLFGVGFNTYRYAQKKYGFLKDDWQASHAGAGADSSLLFVFATGGIFGLLGWLGILAKALEKKSPLVFSSTAAIFVHSFFQNTFFFPWVLGWWIIILGLE